MGNSTSVLLSVVAVPWSLSDLETIREMRGLVPAPVYCTMAIKVSKSEKISHKMGVKLMGAARSGSET